MKNTELSERNTPLGDVAIDTTLSQLKENLMSPTVQDQILWEEEMIRRGIIAYRKAYDRALKAQDETSLAPQHKLMLSAIDPMVKAFDELKEIKGAGRKHRSLFMIKGMDSAELALIVAKSILTGISTKRSFHSVALTIGSIIEEQMIFKAFKTANQVYWKRASDKVNKSTRGQEGRRTALKAYARSAGVDTEKQIDAEAKIAIGAWCVRTFAAETGLIDIVKRKNDTDLVVVSESCSQWLTKTHLKSELLKPVWLPMLIEPNHWVGMRDGGYFTKRLPLVKSHNRGYLNDPLHVPSEKVLTAVNAIQSTPWSINQRVLSVLQELVEAGSTLGGIPSSDRQSLPPLPCPEDDLEMFKVSFKDEWHQWNKKRAEIHADNARLESHRLSLGQAMETASEMAQYDQFFFPWTMDWRGRLYPIASSLSPQGNAVAKGLLQFAQGKPMGTSGLRWLKIHLANCFGVDKVSFEDRIKWVDEHKIEISMCAIDPFTFKLWADADSPWEFLAACFEFEDYQRDPNALSYIPVRVDGSCNGLQHLSAVLRDPVGAKATNLLPSDKPNDIYAQVASLVSTKVTKDAQGGDPIAQAWYGKVDRSVVKRNVMTVSYGATKRGMLDQLAEDLTKTHNGKVAAWLGIDSDESLFPYYKYLSELVQEAIAKVVQAAPTVMGWIQQVAVVAAEEELPLIWKTPAGFSVLHSYRKTKGKQVDAVIGGINITLRINIEQEKLDLQKIKLAVSPNWVHSLDASHCHSTVSASVEKGIKHFAMVHDSYGCHAADMEVMAATLREEFVKMYSGNLMTDLLTQIKNQVGAEVASKLPDPPTQAQLDLSLINQSGYFFA